MAKQKYGGRTIGTPNKLSAEIKSILKDILVKEIQHISVHLEQLSAKDRLDILTKLLPYVISKEIELGFATTIPQIIVPGEPDFE